MTYVYDVTVTYSVTSDTLLAVPTTVNNLNKMTGNGISSANITTAITNMLTLIPSGGAVESIVVTKRAVIS